MFDRIVNTFDFIIIIIITIIIIIIIIMIVIIIIIIIIIYYYLGCRSSIFQFGRLFEFDGYLENLPCIDLISPCSNLNNFLI